MRYQLLLEQNSKTALSVNVDYCTNQISVRALITSVFKVEEAKQELKDVVEFLRNPERFKRLGGKMPTGESKYSTV